MRDADAWMKRAACLDAPPALFFPPDKGHGTEAKAICLTCPVLAVCLDGAVVRGEDTGIWAGAGSDLRRGFERLRKGRPHPEPEVVKGCRCGWCTGLRWHIETLRTGSQAAVRPPVADRNGAMARHGRRSTFNRGCRCDPCTWSATKIGQRLARLGVDTADHWDRTAPAGVSYVEARQVADAAARPLIVAALRALLVALGLEGAWSAEVNVDASSPRRKAKPASSPVA